MAAPSPRAIWSKCSAIASLLRRCTRKNTTPMLHHPDTTRSRLSSGNIEIHPDSAAFLLVLLEHLAEHGEAETLHYIRKNIIEPRFLYAPGVTFD